MAAFSQLKTGKVAGVSRGMMGNGWSDTGSWHSSGRSWKRNFLCGFYVGDTSSCEQTGAVTSGLWFWFLSEVRLPLCTASLRRLVHSTETMILRLEEHKTK